MGTQINSYLQQKISHQLLTYMHKKSPELNKTSEKRTTSLERTNGPSPMCPLFGGFTVTSGERIFKL